MVDAVEAFQAVKPLEKLPRYEPPHRQVLKIARVSEITTIIAQKTIPKIKLYIKKMHS